VTVHQFRTGREIKPAEAVDRDASRAGADRRELLLVCGLVAATMLQAALFVWRWLA
jgi:hypothetical protein